MRKLWIVPALGLALLLVLLLLLGARGIFRGGGGGLRGEEEDGSGTPARARAPSAGKEAAAAIPPEPGGTDRVDPALGPPIDGRLVYLDGAPAAGVLLHLAVGRPLDVRVLRNGERSDKTIHLVTAHGVATTDADGSFRFPGVARPSRSRAFVYTMRDSEAFLVEELVGGGQTVRARRRVKVDGRLADHDGKPLDDYWFEARLGKPEDWQTRVLHEEDTFIGAFGDLGVDTLATDSARTRADGSFSLLLAEGRNTLVFGETKADGSIGIDVALPADLGELRVPGEASSGALHELTGQVLTLAGAPHPGCCVRAWDGSVGLFTHEGSTDEKGEFTISGLRSSNVILWAVPTELRHIDLPVQTSGPLRMPCGAPIVLQAPTEGEYAWARVEVPGFYLFVRKDVFATGDALDRNDIVGLPPGPLDIHLLAGDRILEASMEIREPGDLLLGSARFRDTTWD